VTLHAEFTDEAITQMVHDFYQQVREDAFLSPVFASRIEDWGPHLGRMVAFWTAVLRAEPTYQPGPKGTPPQMHRGIAELERAHFIRWLELFEKIAHETYEPDAARTVVRRSHQMARALSAHLDEPEAAPYRTLRFAAGEIPKSLLTEHDLKRGVHGRLHVREGSLTFVDAEGGRRAVSAGGVVEIASQALHHLEDADDAAIEVELFRIPGPTL